MILLIVLYALLASTFILAKNAVGQANPCFLIGFRMIIAGSLLLGYQMFKNRSRIIIHRGDWGLFFKVAIVHIFVPFVLEFWSLQYLSALKTTLIYSSTPFIAALLAYFLLKERLSFQKVCGVIIGIGGLAPVIAAAATGAEAASMEIFSVSLPEAVLFISVVSASYAWFVVKQLMARGYSLPQINGFAMLGGGIMSMATAGIFEGFANPVHHWPSFLLWVGLLILVANVIFYNLYGMMLKRYSITFVTFSGFLCPAFGALFEWLFMKSTITWHYFVSIVLVTLGLYVFYRDELSVKEIMNK